MHDEDHRISNVPRLVREVGTSQPQQNIINMGKQKIIAIYAPEDQNYLEHLVPYLQDAQAVEIDAALAPLTTTPIHRVLLLMSIDLLHRLVCDLKYRTLCRRLKLLGHEGIVLIVYLRACHWQDSFGHCPAFPAEAITTLPEAAHRAIYQQIVAMVSQ